MYSSLLQINSLRGIAVVFAAIVFHGAAMGQTDLMLQGILDFTVPSGGSNGKAIHLVANSDIADLSVYGVGVANNGGGTDGQEYTFPAIAVAAGDNIFLARSMEAMESYLLTDCFATFEHTLDGTSSISQNGDDAIELFLNDEVIETFGDIDTDGTGEEWDYVDSWAFKVDGAWTYGGTNCTDGTANTFESDCPYPHCAIPEEIPGCTDETAFNYNANATADDGSCEAVLVGCLDFDADNYSEEANTSCEDCCEFLGCTDDTALNYDAEANADDESCIFDTSELSNALMLQGIMDFTVPSGGSDGKAIHFVAVNDIADLSAFGVGVANNGGGTDGQEYSFPAMAVSAGDDILLARSPEAMESYLVTSCYGSFEHVLTASSSISQNGDDAIELFEVGFVIETFGDIDVDGSGEAWDYLDSWAYKVSGEWTYGEVNCTDGTETIADATCVYPLCGGCTDPFFFNYDLMASVDDGSCADMVMFGCTYEEASNYDSAATNDDGSCEVETSLSCLGDLDDDSLVGTPDLLFFLSVFGADCN
tara:strand:- start:1367 stop:2974 length:1608 start_codon:yes stop_codon:yes gene_type:complete